eukprot:TCALIF_05683-PA protein Name:"Similar to T19C3.4 Uncharacterized protein T19C3.4 (Caenorhabditis elegans)" AED:0.47 eAED:0.48 QI:0/0/0/0.33/1/1/3/0/343
MLHVVLFPKPEIVSEGLTALYLPAFMTRIVDNPALSIQAIDRQPHDLLEGLAVPPAIVWKGQVAQSKFPFYYELKIIFLLWLISPVSRGSLGSSMLYRKLIHPNLMKREDEIDRMIGKLQEQGYNTAIRFGSQAFQYVTNLVMTTAIRAPEILAELANAQRPSDQVDGVGNYRPRRIPLQQQNLLGSSPVLEVLDRSDDISMDGLDTFQANELSRQTDVIMDEMNGPASQSSKPGTQRAINFGYSEEEEDDDNQPGALVVTRVPKAKTANLARVPLDFSSGSEDESKPFPSTSNQSVSLPRRGRVAKTKANKALSERSDATLAVEPQKKTKVGRKKKTSGKLN